MNAADPADQGTAVPSAPVGPRRRLFGKYLVFFVGVVLLALVPNALIEYRFLVRDYTGFSERLQRQQAQAAADKIDDFIKDIETQIAWTMQLPWAAATLDEWRLDAARLLQQVPAITEYVRLDARGIEQMRVSRLAPDRIGSGADLSQDPRFTRATADGVYHGPVGFRRDSEPYMTVAVRGAGNDVGFAEINLKFIWDLVSRIQVGEQGKAYVVDDRGRLIAHPNLNLVLRNTDASGLQQVRAARAGAAPAPPEEERPVEDLEGRQVLSASARIAALGWLLLVETPVEEAFAPLDGAIRRMGLVVAAALVIAILAGLILARNMVRPIEALRTGAMRIGAGDFDQRIAIRTGDEVEALADQFNLMAARLQDSHLTLQQRVERRTAELTAANRRLATAGERLRRASTFKSELLGIVAHDLRNPMAVIMARAEMLAKIVDLSDAPREQIATQVASIREAGKQLTDMVDQLLADATTEAHEISLRRTAVSLPALVNEIAQTNLPLAEKKQQTFVVTVPEDATLSGDHDRLREAIDNLVSNAIKYTQRGGRIDLTVSVHEGQALIAVADTGPGLTADDMTHLFGRFQRLSARPTGGEASTGLGLSIVKRIVELHGGKVTAQSRGSGRGSTFVIRLPLTADGAPAHELDATREASRGAAMPSSDNAADRVAGATLVIDDNRDVLESLNELFRSEGLRTVVAASASEALAAIAGNGARPSLIVSDYNLRGDMNGIEGIEALRSALGWRVPAILLTGDSSAPKFETIAGHEVSVLQKPWKGDALMQLVRQLHELGGETDRQTG